MRRARRVVLVGTSVVLVWLAGCGGAGTVPQPKAKAKPAQAAPKGKAASWQTAPPSLPDWAPKHPSPEFVRAARVLKPVSLDIMKSPGTPEAENAARVHGALLMWPAAYEFFGTLSDAQIEHFLRTKQVMVPSEKPGQPPKRRKGSQILIPVKKLTRNQRAALDEYLEAYREANRGQTNRYFPEFRDCLLVLYKMGATRDLSNVLVGMDTAECGGGHLVSILFRVTRPDGTATSMGSNFAQI